MEVRTHLLAALLYFAAGAVIVWIAVVAIPSFTSDDAERLAQPQNSPNPRTPPLVAPSGVNSARADALRRRAAMSAEHIVEIERLREQVRQKTVLVDAKNELLDKKSKQYNELKLELNQSLAMLMQLLPPAVGEDADGNSKNPTGDDPDNHRNTNPEIKPESKPTAADLKKITEELNKTRLMETAMSAELEQLKQELNMTRLEIAQLQQEADLETALLVDNHRNFRATTAAAMRRGGASAASALVELLTNRQPDVRVWAAQALGEIGPAARDAIPALLELRADREQSVRDAAAQAIAVIERD